MVKYRLSEDGVYNREIGRHIPNAPGNRHWSEYQAWLSEGNTPDPQYTLEEYKVKAKSEAKAKAAGDIVAAYPEWQQRNHLAFVLSVIDANTKIKGKDTGEDAKLDEIRAAWADIDAKRAKSNKDEADIDAAGTIEEVDAILNG